MGGSVCNGVLGVLPRVVEISRIPIESELDHPHAGESESIPEIVGALIDVS